MWSRVGQSVSWLKRRARVCPHQYPEREFIGVWDLKLGELETDGKGADGEGMACFLYSVDSSEYKRDAPRKHRLQTRSGYRLMDSRLLLLFHWISSSHQNGRVRGE